MEKNEIELGNTSVKRDFTYVDDLSECYSMLIDKEMPSLSILNVGSGQNHSVKEIVDTVCSILGKNIEIKVDESKVRENDLDEVASIEKIKALGWQASVEFEEGLKRIINS